MEMISGVIYMTLNYETFEHAVKFLHDIMFKVTRPDSDEEYTIISNFIEGYMALLADFNKETYITIRTFVLSHKILHQRDILSLYKMITEEPAKFKN